MNPQYTVYTCNYMQVPWNHSQKGKWHCISDYFHSQHTCNLVYQLNLSTSLHCSDRLCQVDYANRVGRACCTKLMYIN